MNNSRYIFLLIFLCSTLLKAQDLTKVDGSKISPDTLDLKIRDLIAKANVSGLSIMVINNNAPVFSRAYGYADVAAKAPLKTSTVMYGASFSKAVFAYIVMQLVQEKVIDLDKPLVTYLEKDLTDYSRKRGYQDLKEDLQYKKITGRMCLDHTAGFPNWRWIEEDKKLKIKFDPGTRYSYSGEGLYLLQFIIEQITGKDYESIAQERVFKPFGMLNTSYIWQDRFKNNLCLGHNSEGTAYEFSKRSEANCAGSMCTSMDDYTKFFIALMQHKGLKKDIFQEMISPQIRIRSKQQFGPNSRIDTNDNDSIKLSYGLGVGLIRTPFGEAFFKEGHDDGWGHYSIAFVKEGIGVIIMTNNDNGESIFKELLEVTIGDTYTPWYWENYIPYSGNR